MIVICKKDHDEYTGGITVGKKYVVNKLVDHLVGVSDCKPVMEILYDIENDNGRTMLYSEELFITLDEDRNNKLNELGI
jgi:hypothetical protein